ncbi:MAG: YcaO-like family protein [Acidobacteriota bacterium]|nr:YcaO-like family protein [Acidobacteriota bacterium]
MTTLTQRERYCPYARHVDLRPLGESKTLLLTPGGDAYEVESDPETIGSLLARCNGTRTLEEISAGMEDPKGMREILDVLCAEGCLSEQAEDESILKQWNLVLTGDADMAARALRFCGAWGSVLHHDDMDLDTPAHPERTVVLHLSPYIDGYRLVDLGRQCAEAGCRWTQFHVDMGKGYLGPFVVPGRTSDYEDLVGRRRCSGDDVEGAQLRRPLLPEEGAPRAPALPNDAALDWMLAVLFHQIEQAVRQRPCRLYSTELEADPESLTLTPHHILPLPTRAPQSWLTSPATPYDMVVDRRTGIVLSQHAVEHHESVPTSLTTVRSHCTDLSRIYPWGNDLFTGGSAFNDPASARGASLGEALERYCGNCLPGVHMVKGSYESLTASGRRALDPESLILHSRKMLSQRGCPFVPFTRDLEVYWVEGRSLTRDEPCLLPLPLVYANWMGGDLKQPITNYLYTPGMAAGENLERALVGAVRELVERDITMAWWLNAHPLPSVKPTPALAALWRGVPEREHQRVRYIHLDNPFNIPVMVAVVENTLHQFLNIGFGCRPDPETAARKALTEALTLQEGSRDLNQPDSTLRRSTEEWGLLNTTYRPWSADRRYMDVYRDDFRDLDDLMLQQQFFLDPRAIERVRPIVDTPETRTFADLPVLAEDRLQTYRDPIESTGFEILYADITSPDVALTGYKVVRAIIPGLIPNMPAAFPAVGGSRVFDLPVQMGWRREPLTEEELNYFPMPHA